MRVVVAMSGGVDSSVTAALLLEQGHEVIGLAMKTHSMPAASNRACCTPDDMRDARRVAERLGISFYVLNYTELFQREVVGPFAEAYRRGQTPNPCIVCNDRVKFRPLLERARLLGADQLATGHYARIVHGRRLLRGRDVAKDQSYFLYRLGGEQLAALSFPLGDLTKDEVREHARRLGLSVAEKAESQEICFVGDDGYAATVEALGGGGPMGRFVDAAGQVVGEHRGIHRYTIGQRRGLGLSAPEPLYVTDIDAATGDIRVGVVGDLLAETAVIRQLHWIEAPPDPSEVVGVQQRYRSQPRPAHVVSMDREGDRAVLRFVDPEPRGAPGQAAVIYRADEVLGGGVLAEFGKGATPGFEELDPTVARGER